MVDKTAFDYVNEIWGIANYVRDVIRSADYNKLILPFAVLRRFECALEPTRGAVCKRVAKGTWADDDPKYCGVSGHCFYNVTSFSLSNLGAVNTCDALMAYINGFSANAREVLQRFEMCQTCEKLDEKGMRGRGYSFDTLRVFLVKSVFRVSSLIFFGFRHEECRPVVCFTGCPSCRT